VDANDLELRLSGTGVPDGELGLDNLAGVALALQLLARRIGATLLARKAEGVHPPCASGRGSCGCARDVYPAHRREDNRTVPNGRRARAMGPERTVVGALVEVRGRRWVVADVEAAGSTLVELQSVEDGRYGESPA
jgi:hypothetical protein